MKVNTDEGITQYWKRVANKAVSQNKAVFTKMTIKGEIARLESIGISKSFCPQHPLFSEKQLILAHTKNPHCQALPIPPHTRVIRSVDLSV